MAETLEYDPFAEIMRHDPFPVYARLRAESPVHYVERLDAWALSRFEDVWSAGQDGEHFDQPGPSFQNIGDEEPPIFQGDDPGRRTIFMMNPPHHTALRKALTRYFSPRAVAELEGDVRAQVRACLAKVLPTGRMDAIADLAGQVSVAVACRLIGLPAEDGAMLSGLVARFFSREPGVEGMSPAAMAAAVELNEYLKRTVALRRREGVGARDDILDVYLAQAFDGQPYDDDEMAGHLMTLVVGGTETLPKVFAGGVLQLARHPAQRAHLVARPDEIRDAFTEILRYEMPTQLLTRKVRRDVELRGQRLREGQGVLLLYRSANRDENEFAEPDRFDVARRPPRILSFGHGGHVCLGQHAARLEARVMYEELLAAVPEYDVPEASVVRAHSEFVDGYLAMPIEFEKRELAG
ncbi:MAG: cytochrome P450 [Myxococcota bacterium]